MVLFYRRKKGTQEFPWGQRACWGLALGESQLAGLREEQGGTASPTAKPHTLGWCGTRTGLLYASSVPSGADSQGPLQRGLVMAAGVCCRLWPLWGAETAVMATNEPGFEGSGCYPPRLTHTSDCLWGISLNLIFWYNLFPGLKKRYFSSISSLSPRKLPVLNYLDNSKAHSLRFSF